MRVTFEQANPRGSGDTTAACHRRPAEGVTTVQRLHELEEVQKKLSAEIGRARQAGRDASDLIDRHRELSREIDQITATVNQEPLSAAEIETEIVTDSTEFADMRSAWSDLVSRSDCYSPFLLWEWLYPWWETYGDGRGLFVVVARRGARMVGVAPLMIGLTRGRRVTRRRLAFLGTGERAEGDYFDFIVAGECADDARAALWRRAASEVKKERRVAEFHHVLARGDGIAQLGRLAVADGAELLITPRRNAVVGPLPDSFDRYLQQSPTKNRRYYLRRQSEDLRSAFGDVRHWVAASGDQVDTILDRMEEFSTTRLAATGEGSAWADPKFRRCMRAACRLLLARRSLRAEALDVQGRTVATLLGFVHQGTYFCYQMAFDQDYAQHMPGHCLLERCIRSCIEDGLERFDFLAGEHEYKRTYFPGRQRLADLTLYWPTARNLLDIGAATLSKSVRRAAKDALHRLHLRRHDVS